MIHDPFAELNQLHAEIIDARDMEAEWNAVLPPPRPRRLSPGFWIRHDRAQRPGLLSRLFRIGRGR
jgi:hypothetical protein